MVMEHGERSRALGEQRDHALNALVRPFLVVALRPGYRLQQPLPLVRNALDGVVYPMRLPRVFDEQDREQQLHVVPQLLAVGEGDLPEELREDRAREVRVLPRAVLEELD